MASSRSLLGISMFEIGDYNGARRELGRALRLNPNDRRVKLYLARTLLKIDEYDSAARLLQELQRDDPGDPQVLYTLGSTYMNLAASTFERLQKADPDSYLIELLLGKTAEDKQAFAEAIEHYRNALSRAPNARSLHYTLGNVLWKDGQMPEALQEFRRELELNPYDYMASAKAALLLVEENPREALGLANRALELSPDLSQALLARGRALLLLKDPAKAVVDFKKLIAMDSEDDAVHYQLARAYRQLGFVREAEAEDAIFQRMEKAVHLPKQPSKSTPRP
jgi:predicted Zn-dependent protease